MPILMKFCENNTTLRANPAVYGTGTWSEIPATLANITTPSANVTTVTGIWSGKRKFQWVIDNEGCKSYDTINSYIYRPFAWMAWIGPEIWIGLDWPNPWHWLG